MFYINRLGDGYRETVSETKNAARSARGTCGLCAKRSERVLLDQQTRMQSMGAKMKRWHIHYPGMIHAATAYGRTRREALAAFRKNWHLSRMPRGFACWQA